MLALTQTQPFKYTIGNLKSLSHQQQIDKHQLQIKAILKTINQITNLNQSLKLLLDELSYARLMRIVATFMRAFSEQRNIPRVGETTVHMRESPDRGVEINKSLLLKHTKYIDLTPSTKKSRVFSTHTMPHLIQDLIDSLQKFDELKQHSNQIKSLIQLLYDGLNQSSISQTDEECEHQEMDVEMLWRGISLANVQEKIGQMMDGVKLGAYFELLEHLENVNRAVENIKTAAVEIYNFYEPQSIDEQEDESRDSYQRLQAATKKSNHPSSQRSLLTEMLKDSSQKSMLQLPSEQNQYSSQIVLRPRLRFNEYSQNQQQAHLDEQFKFSYKSAKFNHKSYNKEIRSEMNYYQGTNDENILESSKIVKRKEVKVKKSEMSCSRCEIY